MSRIVAPMLLAALPWLAACGDPAVVEGPGFDHYLEKPSPFRLVEVLAGKDDRQRLDVVVRALEANQIAYAAEPYGRGPENAGSGQGTNLIARYGRGRDLLIIAAHYDRVTPSPGANDNASCVAAAIEAYRLLVDSGPLNNITARFVFTDDEESGLLGAAAHRAGLARAGGTKLEKDKVLGVISFEMCGVGDSFGIWDVEGPAENSAIVRALAQAGAELDIYNGTHGAVPRFGSDHRVFARAGIPAVGVTVLPREDEARLREYVENPNSLKWLFRFMRPAIFRTYHTAGDTPETIDPAALEMTARVIAATVRNLDRLAGSEVAGG